MSKKNFFVNVKKINSHSLRLVNKEFMPKSFIREIFSENKNIKIIDNSYSINDILLKNNKNNNKKKRGNSIKIDNQILKNKFWHMIQLNVPVLANEKSKNLTINFIKNFSLFLKKQKVLVSILETKKGGFIARSFGILGFLPLKQYLSLNKKRFLSSKLKKSETKTLKKIAPYYFSNTCKLSLKQKTSLKASKKKWRFLVKARPWFKKLKKINKKKKNYKKLKKNKETRKIRTIKKKSQKKFKNKKCPFIFYNSNEYTQTKTY